MIKHLVLLRHAETEPAFPEGGDDAWRRLTQFGMKQCQRISTHLDGTNFDLVLCSPARRTLDTAKLAFVGHYSKLISSDPLYNASASQLTDRIARLEESVTRVALVAHNPGISQCVEELASGTAKPALPMMPGTLISFTFVGKWQAIGKGKCQLADVFTP